MEVAQKKTRAPKTTNKQLDFLITYMENHTAFATGKLLGARGKPAHDLQWQQLTDQLNSLNGPSKGIEGWKKISFILYFLLIKVLFPHIVSFIIKMLLLYNISMHVAALV